MDGRQDPASNDPVRAGARRHLAARADAFLARHRGRLLALAALLALAVAAAWVVAKTTSLLPHTTSRTVAEAYARHHGPVRDVALAIASLGDAGIALVTVGILALHGFLRGGLRAATLPVATAAIVVVTTIAKELPGRATSLPSGHAAYALAIGGYAAWLLLRGGRPWPAAIVLVLALLMAPARVIEGAHEPADVLAAVALAVAWLLVVVTVGERWAARRRTAPAS